MLLIIAPTTLVKPMTDPHSTTALWLITLTVLGLTALFLAIAAMAKRRRRPPPPHQVADAAVAVASLEKARTIAKEADHIQQS